VIAAFTAGGIAYYNWRITGSALTLPYTLYSKTYMVSPIFVWESEQPAPSYSNDIMRRMHVEWEPEFQRARSQSTLAGWIRAKLSEYPILVLAALLLCGVISQEHRIGLLAALLATFLVGLCLQRYVQLHYLAPIVPALAAVFMLFLRRISLWQYAGRRIGHGVAIAIFATAFGLALFRGIQSMGWYSGYAGSERAAIESRLATIPGRHLVVVRYGPTHNVLDELVYNTADIDRSRIVWACDMGPEADQQLLAYYSGRKFWLLQPDVSPPLLEPLPPHSAIDP
jgi:hypothetical protein